MATIPKICAPTAGQCTLRQALQWIRDDIEPVELAYEPVLGIPQDLYGDLRKEKSALYAAIRSEKLPLTGRSGQGQLWVDERNGPWGFQRTGERERVPLQNLDEAGLDQLDFQGNWIGKITDWDAEGLPIAGWAYYDLRVPTADLKAIFPDDPFEEPSPIELPRQYDSEVPAPSDTTKLPEARVLFLAEVAAKIAACTGADWDASATALHRALAGGELIARNAQDDAVPPGDWRYYASTKFIEELSWDVPAWSLQYGNPTIERATIDRWLGGDPCASTNDKSAITTREPALTPSECDLPPYLEFAIGAFRELGATIQEMKKDSLIAALKERWPEDRLGSASDVLIGYMATMLRPPEAKTGGAKPARRMLGSTGSTPRQI